MNKSLLPLLLCCAALVGGGQGVRADHPQILVAPADRPAVQAKVAQTAWAKQGFGALQARIDALVEKTLADPKYVSSRLMMNWDTRYTTTLVEKARTVGGEGRAEVPTPRFEGARNWATDYSRPEKFEDWLPYNDKGGKIYLLNKKTGQMEWVEPGITGHNTRNANQQIMGYAADAAFAYWVTGDEKYARFSTEILATYMEGFSQTTAPKLLVPDEGLSRIIGVTSFEVIHENIVVPIALSYDFLYPYLVQQGKDVKMMQEGLRRFAARVTDGGGRDGNWNLNQAMMITYAGLALEGNEAYADGKGRPFYVDVVLNADLPRQKGLTQVIKEGFDPATGLWPEAAGYGFGSAAQMVEFAFLLSGDTAGAQLMANPMLPQSLANQGEVMYPNGVSNAVGDTGNARMRTESLENMVAWARKTGNAALEARLTPYLQREIASGNHDRHARSDIFALACWVGELKPVDAAPTASRSFWYPGLNILMQRNLAANGSDVAHSLAAALYGTDGGHVHQNGLAIELFGAGYVLGVDSGIGTSYWEPDHRGYYVTPVAHNTVVVNGASNYDEYKDPLKAMKVESLEPASQQAAMSPNIGFARGSFRYAAPEAEQQRTLALIRTGPKTGFYFDVFRSRAKTEAGSFHDYFYHNMGESLSLGDSRGTAIALAPTTTLSTQSGLMKAYGFLKNEKSAAHESDLRATFTMQAPDKTQPTMNLWMTGQEGRTVFSLEAPANRAARGYLPAEYSQMPLPTLMVRQQGEAWNRPFVALYEPFLAPEGASVQSVRAAGGEGMAPTLVAQVVEGRADNRGYRVFLFQDADSSAARKTENMTFQGDFGAVIERGGEVEELLLSGGQKMGTGHFFLSAREAVRANLRRESGSWVYSASAPVRAGMLFPVPARARDVKGWTLRGATQSNLRVATLPSGAKVVIATAVLPAGENVRLSLQKAQ